MELMELYERIKEELESWGTDDLVEIWNDYCNECNYMDDYIEYNNPDEFMCGRTPSEVLEQIGSDYDIHDDYAVYTIYGWESFNSTYDEHCPIDVDTLADWISEEEDGHGYDKLQDIIDEYLEEEEAEEPDDIDSDLGYDPYMGQVTDDV